MKKNTVVGLVVAGLLWSGSLLGLIAQNAPAQGRQGNGYGTAPKTQEERAARQASCLEKNGGVCPKGGPAVSCPGRGQGQGLGAGPGARNGLRDGTGPRRGTGTCPLTPPAPAQK